MVEVVSEFASFIEVGGPGTPVKIANPVRDLLGDKVFWSVLKLIDHDLAVMKGLAVDDSVFCQSVTISCSKSTRIIGAGCRI